MTLKLKENYTKFFKNTNLTVVLSICIKQTHSNHLHHNFISLLYGVKLTFSPLKNIYSMYNSIVGKFNPTAFIHHFIPHLHSNHSAALFLLRHSAKAAKAGG